VASYWERHRDVIRKMFAPITAALELSWGSSDCELCDPVFLASQIVFQAQNISGDNAVQLPSCRTHTEVIAGTAGLACPPHSMTTVSIWRCKCGVRIKVISDLDRDHPSETREVACPKCGHKQKVHGQTIVSVTAQQVVSSN